MKKINFSGVFSDGILLSLRSSGSFTGSNHQTFDRKDTNYDQEEEWKSYQKTPDH